MCISVSMSPCAWWLVVYHCVVHVAMLNILPIQRKGVVELHMWMSNGVEGRQLLQSLHQLHNGLIILHDKKAKNTLMSSGCIVGLLSVHLCSNVLQTLELIKVLSCSEARGRVSDVFLFILSGTQLSA